MQYDFWQPFYFLAASLIFFTFIFGRYFIVAGFSYLYFFIWKKDQWKKRRLNTKDIDKKQLRREVGWSMLTALIFSFTGSVSLLLLQEGYLKLYFNAHDYSIWWLPLSLVSYILIQETYYYWVHRFMHIPGVFSVVHKVHHESHITSPWTSFSFHPLESILQAIVIPLILMVIPIHYYVLIVLLTFMTVSSVINHMGIEVYPRNANRTYPGRLFIGATHHSLHHKQFKYNFGLYFTFWDKWKHTESPRFAQRFEEVTQ